MPKPDMTDDWWDQRDKFDTYQLEPPTNKIEYLIERAEKQITFGFPGYIKKWRFWAKFDTAKERDAELKRLRKEHPAWRLRATTTDPAAERAYRSFLFTPIG